MKLRALYAYDVDAASDDAAFYCEGDSLTQQSGKDEADINTIARRFGLSGVLPRGVRMPTFGDFTGVGDFQSALSAVEAARDSFMAMPAVVRRRFENDPAQFVAFCSDPANAKEAAELGLVAVKEPTRAPAAPGGAPVVSAAPAAVVAAPAASGTVST